MKDAPRVSRLAVASLILGVLWLWWAGSLLAVILGHKALGRINRSNGSLAGKSVAAVGVVLGWVGLWFLLIVLYLNFGGLLEF